MTIKLTPVMSTSNIELAVQIADASFTEAHAQGLTNKLAGTYVVIPPNVPAPSTDPSSITLEQVRAAATLIRVAGSTFPNPERYDTVALEKARLLWALRTAGWMGHSFSTRQVQQDMPHLYRPGLIKWHGGVCVKGLIVTFSGVQGNYDEVFAIFVAELILAMSREAMTDADAGVMASESGYVPDASDPRTISIGALASEGVFD